MAFGLQLYKLILSEMIWFQKFSFSYALDLVNRHMMSKFLTSVEIQMAHRIKKVLNLVQFAIFADSFSLNPHEICMKVDGHSL